MGVPGWRIAKLLCKLSSPSKLGAMQTVSLYRRSNREFRDGEKCVEYRRNVCRFTQQRESVVMVVHSEVAFITSPLIERIESLEKDEIARKRCS